MQKISSHDYCRNFVREKDYNLYLLHFFMPRHMRNHALAFMALHCEILSIPQKTQDKTMIFMRLKWWYDNTMGLLNGVEPVNSPILESLSIPFQDNILHKNDVEIYFTEIEKKMNDEKHTVQAQFDRLLINLAGDQKARFESVLHKHHEMKGDSPFRALRLWLSCIKHC